MNNQPEVTTTLHTETKLDAVQNAYEALAVPASQYADLKETYDLLMEKLNRVFPKNAETRKLGVHVEKTNERIRRLTGKLAEQVEALGDSEFVTYKNV